MCARLYLYSMELRRFANDDVTRRDPAAAIARDFPIAVCDHEGAIVPRLFVKPIIPVGAKNVMHQASRPIILAREVPFLQISAALITAEHSVRGAEGGHCNVDTILEFTKGRLANRGGRHSQRPGCHF